MAIAATTQRIPPELEAEMSPAVRAFILSLFDKIDALSTKVLQGISWHGGQAQG